MMVSTRRSRSIGSFLHRILKCFIDNESIRGFYTAFKSVKDSILQILEMGLEMSREDHNDQRNRPWSIFVTGHSLGGLSSLPLNLCRFHHGIIGALATLMSFHLGLMRSGMLPSPLHSSLQTADIVTYNFGSPRVGNIDFARVSVLILCSCFII